MKKKKTWIILLSAVLLLVVSAAVFWSLRGSKHDFSRLTWTKAFDRLYETMSEEYAFTDWKGINWESLRGQYRPQIEAAQAANDFGAYYMALHAFLHELPDGHVRMNHIDEVDNQYIGGGFGFSIAQTDDGKLLAVWVDESGPAWKAGVRIGDELTQWNGKTAKEAVSDVSTVLAGTSATAEDLLCKKLQYLVRSPIGTQVRMVWKSKKDRTIVPVTLTAYDDQKISLKKVYPNSVVSDKLRDMFLEVENPDPAPASIVETKIIDGDIYYIKLWAELDADLQETGKAQSTLALFRAAVQQAIEHKCGGMILDIRNNIGGLDAMAADILGSFYEEKIFYEYQNIYIEHTKTRSIQLADEKNEDMALYINPAEQQFQGPVIALINQKCISSGEGIALGIKNLLNGETLGFYGTNGSFGLAGEEAKMPGELTIHWPSGQSLDEQKMIQLDSRNGAGGVSPSIRIPMSEQNIVRTAKGEDVELEEAVRIIQNAQEN